MSKLFIILFSVCSSFIQSLTEEFSIIRVWYFNRIGFSISKKAKIFPNVNLRRKVVIGDYCKIDKMGFLFGDYNEGIRFGDYVNIATNCRIQGKGIIASISSISHNGSISGEHEGVVIGEDVMIGPKVVFVAFNHGFELIDVPMKNQQNTEESILIKYNVWIGANVTIGKGVTIG